MTSMRRIMLAAIAMLIPLTAQAQKPTQKSVPSVPPLQYDYRFQGHMTLTRGNADVMRDVCPTSSFYPVVPLACNHAYRLRNMCHVYIADDEILKAEKMPYDAVYRHEIGHCNGWPGDHLGWRQWPAPAGKAPLKISR
jgi:hypothetical protein